MRNAVLVGAGALTLAIGGITYGATRASDATISVCVEPASQTLTLAPAGGCTGGAQTLSWNQQGPQGVQGVQGVSGTAGIDISTAPSVVLGPVAVKRFGFTTSLDVSGTGAHLVEGHVQVHLDPSQWKIKGFVRCLLFVSGSSTPLDSTQTYGLAHGVPQTYNVDLSGIVTIAAPASSGPSISTAPTDQTVLFRCLTSSHDHRTADEPTFAFVRMSDTLEKYILKPLVVKAIKVGP